MKVNDMLKKENGNIVLSITIMIFAAVSGMIFSLIAVRDSVFTDYALDKVQQVHLIRSEMNRGLVATGYFGTSTNHMLLPIREVQIDSGLNRSTHAIKTSVSRNIEGTAATHRNRRTVISKAKTFRGRSSTVSYYGDRNKTPIETAASRTFSNRTLAGYMYFTDCDQSIFGTEVWFYGYDVLWGKVHSNTKIHFKNVGGWPRFHAMVTAPEGEGFEFYPYTPNYDDLFLGGWDERAARVVFEPTADLIRHNGQAFPANWATTDILYCEVSGMSVTYYTGQIVAQPLPTTLPVYDSYPPYGDVGDQIDTNTITFVDTVWTGPHSWTMAEGSVMTFSELWLKGRFLGAQTWGCSKDIYLVDDITLAGTPPGNAPDGSDGTSVNTRDYVGIVSEKSIYVGYGYKHPYSNERLQPNCGTLDIDSSYPGIIIYAAMCAMGDGGDDHHQDGIFTFEYQFPHRATVDQGGYTYIDLHLCKYPPANPPNWPWPANTPDGIGFADNFPDYPWYNPIWPESLPYRERGNIFIWGSVAQRRRGFVHRSGNSDNDTGWWDIENYRFGPLPATGQNAPDSDGNGIGYDKDYRYDNRFIQDPPPDYPEVHLEGGQSDLEEVAFRYMMPPRNF